MNKKIPHWKVLKVECFRLNLDGLKVFEILSDDEVERTFNYIGPDRLPEKIRLKMSEIFHIVLPAVLIHDCRFVIGGNKAEFYASNAELKKNMYTCLRANRKEFNAIEYLFARIRVYIAYKLCNKYGYEGWNKTESKD